MAYVSRKGGGKGGTMGYKTSIAINDSNAEFNLSACPTICTKPRPRSKGQGKGRPLKRQGKGVKSSPEESQPQARGGESRTYHRKNQVPEVSEHLQLDNQNGLPFVRLQASQGNVSKAPPSQKSAGPASVKTGGGGSSSVLRREPLMLPLSKEKPARPRRKGHPAKESRILRETASHDGQRRSSPRGPRN